MRNFYKLLLIIFIPAFSFAQSNFKPGYVVTSKGDTLRGFVNYKEWNLNPDAIEFKTKETDNRSQKFTPEDITFFNVDDLESYQKFSGKIGTNYIDPERITTGKDTSFKMASVFLKIMTKGKYVTLLSYTDDIRPHFYIQEPTDSAPVELVYDLYRNDDAGSKTVADNTYMRQLYFLAQKYNVLTDGLQNDIQYMNYSAGNILDILRKVNGPEQRQKVKRNNDKPSVIFFAGAGVNITKTTPADAFKPLGATEGTSYLPIVSGGLDLLVNPNVGQLMLRCELSFAGISYRSDYKDKVYPYADIVYKYSVVSAAFTPQLIYNFYNGENFKFFGGLGMSFTYYNYMNASYTDKNGAPVYGNSADPYAFIKFHAPIMLKAGVQLNEKIEIYANYLTSAPVSQDNTFRLDFSSIQAGVNYHFK